MRRPPEPQCALCRPLPGPTTVCRQCGTVTAAGDGRTRYDEPCPCPADDAPPPSDDDLAAWESWDEGSFVPVADVELHDDESDGEPHWTPPPAAGAWEIRLHLADQHDLPAKGLGYQRLMELHDKAHAPQLSLFGPVQAT